jgi:glycosyltransferase involved in cell wall biosynthesis
MKLLGIDYEIVIVNDGSTDDTFELASAMAGEKIRIVDYKENRGKGYAINRGMMSASGDYRLFMDMDLSTALTEIPKFLQCVQDGLCDICVGNRQSVGVWSQHRPWHRALLGRIFAFLSVVSSGCQLDDFTCGFKIFTAQACEKIFPRQSIYNWAFDTELMFIAHQLGLRVDQKPVEWHHHYNSKVNIGPAVMTSFMSLVKIWYLRKGDHDGNNRRFQEN